MDAFLGLSCATPTPFDAPSIKTPTQPNPTPKQREITFRFRATRKSLTAPVCFGLLGVRNTYGTVAAHSGVGSVGNCRVRRKDAPLPPPLNRPIKQTSKPINNHTPLPPPLAHHACAHIRTQSTSVGFALLILSTGEVMLIDEGRNVPQQVHEPYGHLKRPFGCVMCSLGLALFDHHHHHHHTSANNTRTPYSPTHPHTHILMHACIHSGTRRGGR